MVERFLHVPGIKDLPIRVVKAVWDELPLILTQVFDIKYMLRPKIVKQISKDSYTIQGPEGWRAVYMYLPGNIFQHIIGISYVPGSEHNTYAIAVEVSAEGRNVNEVRAHESPIFNQIWNEYTAKKAMGGELGGLLDL